MILEELARTGCASELCAVVGWCRSSNVQTRVKHLMQVFAKEDVARCLIWRAQSICLYRMLPALVKRLGGVRVTNDFAMRNEPLSVAR